MKAKTPDFSLTMPAILAAKLTTGQIYPNMKKKFALRKRAGWWSVLRTSPNVSN